MIETNMKNHLSCTNKANFCLVISRVKPRFDHSQGQHTLNTKALSNSFFTPLHMEQFIRRV